jgi:peptide-methionine (S)-S-oxide reductase
MPKLSNYFDPKKSLLRTVRDIFATHDPTTLNRQGADVGTQYRSEIFFITLFKNKYLRIILLLTSENTFGKPIVTKISAASIFYAAEEYHQNYYNQNKTQGYCSYVITPKIDKLKSISR